MEQRQLNRGGESGEKKSLMRDATEMEKNVLFYANNGTEDGNGMDT